MTVLEQMRELIDKLNYLTKKYDEGHPEVSDKEWDDLYFQLFDLEQSSGQYYQDSPTRQVNYQVVNELRKVEHNHKMLSLDKTKSLDDVATFSNGQEMVAMTKCDGLTCSLRYIDGNLVSAETRGNGVIGEDVLHNALTIPTIPHKIQYTDELIIDGEIVCLINDFQDFADDYKNPRNFAAGSIRLLDSKECAGRKLSFVAWDVIKGFEDVNSFAKRLTNLKSLGFFIVPFIKTNIFDENIVSVVVTLTTKLQIPFDGLVFKFEDIAYGLAQGETAHHLKNAIAYKFYDDEYETTLRDIEWSMGRTGVLTPIAVYDDIEIDGSICNRASLHNINIMSEILGTPYKEQKIWIYKANMIIPQVSRAEKLTSNVRSHFDIPKICPICGGTTELITSSSGTTELFCTNPSCDGKLVNKLDHFCGKKGLDIRGLSLATLDKLVDWGWVNSPIDIYSLKDHKKEWVLKPGFGEKSVQNILDAIEESKNCSLEAFIAALGIPLIGRTISKELAKRFSSYDEFSQAIKDRFDFTKIGGFADAKSSALLDFDYSEADQLCKILNIQKVETESKEEVSQSLAGKNYVITGTVKQFKNRAELQDFIEKRGGKVLSRISKNVNYLINNDSTSTSAKNVAAKKMGIPILTEAEFLESVN